MNDPNQQFLKIAQQVTLQYAIDDADFSQVGHMNYGNYGIVKYSVILKNKTQKHLLSIHYAKSDYDILKQKKSFESHHLWIEALDQDTDLTVQTPIRNATGELLTPYPATDQCEALCVLLHWVEGDVVSDDDQLSELTPTLISDMGKLLAKLHHHASQWQRPSSFTRPTFDTETISVSLDRLRPLRSEKISESDFSTLEKVCEKICNHLNACEKTNETWGLVHGDFHGANCVLFENDLRPIDFDFCRFGYFLYDIAYTFKYIEPNLRAAFIDGYENMRKLPSDYQKTAETLLIAQRINRWSQIINHSSFAMVPPIVASEFTPFLNDQPFLFEIPPWDWNE